MNIEPSIWANVHGGVTHFPIALILFSAFCDCVSLCMTDRDVCRGFRFAGAISLVIGGMGGSVAILSGLIIARWQFIGHSSLLMHHKFVWPSFVLVTGLATWRISLPRRIWSRPKAVYIALLLLAAACMTAAGYWGGEMLNEG